MTHIFAGQNKESSPIAGAKSKKVRTRPKCTSTQNRDWPSLDGFSKRKKYSLDSCPRMSQPKTSLVAGSQSLKSARPKAMKFPALNTFERYTDIIEDFYSICRIWCLYQSFKAKSDVTFQILGSYYRHILANCMKYLEN